MSDSRPILAITAGDPNGIGPEVALKAMRDERVQGVARCVLLGSPNVLAEQAERFGLGPIQTITRPDDRVAEGAIRVLDVLPGETPAFAFGATTPDGGRQAMHAVETAVMGCLAGSFAGMVTAPISKEAIQRARYAFPGHTEFLADRTRTERYVMLLVSGGLRVALVTIHDPVAAVAELITKDRILATLETVDQTLRQDFGIERPRMAVLGLNPHAGDGGVIGREEIETIIPALDEARARGLHVEGPHPADGFFGQRGYERVDAILAMYHDQGLAPFKALAMGGGVNVTGGLPIVRTSPDHGTAFAIAGTGTASSDSMREAIVLAAAIANRRAAAASTEPGSLP